MVSDRDKIPAASSGSSLLIPVNPPASFEAKFVKERSYGHAETTTSTTPAPGGWGWQGNTNKPSGSTGGGSRLVYQWSGSRGGGSSQPQRYLPVATATTATATTAKPALASARQQTLDDRERELERYRKLVAVLLRRLQTQKDTNSSSPPLLPRPISPILGGPTR